MAARSKECVCDRSPAEIVGSNPTVGMDVCLLWVLCDVRERSLRRTDHSSRGILPAVVRRCVWSRHLVNEEVMPPVGLLRQKLLYKNTVFPFPFQHIFFLNFFHFFHMCKFLKQGTKWSYFYGKIMCQISIESKRMFLVLWHPVIQRVSNSKVGTKLELYNLYVRNCMDNKYWKWFLRKWEPTK